MKTKPVKEILITIILIFIGILIFIRLSRYVDEGFVDATSEQSAYENLRIKLKNVTEPYCKIANLVEQQMMEMYMVSKVTDPLPKPPENPIAEPSEGPPKSSNNKAWWEDSKPAKTIPELPQPTPSPGETKEEARNHIMQTYTTVYNCTDQLSEYRPQCGGATSKLFKVSISHPDWKYIPCTAYTNLPPYNKNDIDLMLKALMNIPNNTPDKLLMEVFWYESVIKKLQEGLDKGNIKGGVPPSIPEKPEMPKEEGKDESPPPPKPNPKIPGPSAGAIAAQNKLLASHGIKSLGSKSEGFFDGAWFKPAIKVENDIDAGDSGGGAAAAAAAHVPSC